MVLIGRIPGQLSAQTLTLDGISSKLSSSTVFHLYLNVDQLALWFCGRMSLKLAPLCTYNEICGALTPEKTA